jgi:hypothetical protein
MDSTRTPNGVNDPLGILKSPGLCLIFLAASDKVKRR